MPHHVEKSRHGLYYLRLPKRLAHFNSGKRICLKTHSKRLAISRARHHIQAIDLCMSLKVNDATPATAAAEYTALKQSLEHDFKEENDNLDLLLKKAAVLPDSSEVVRQILQRRLRNVLVKEAMTYIGLQFESGASTPGATPRQQLNILNSLLNFAENIELEFTSARQPDGSISRSSLEGAKNAFRAEIFSHHEALAERMSAIKAQTSGLAQAEQLHSGRQEKPPLTLYELHRLQQVDAEELEGETTLATKQEYDRYARVLTVISGRRAIQDFTKEIFDKIHKATRKIRFGTVRSVNIESSSVSDMIPPEGTQYKTISAETARSYSLRLSAIHTFAWQQGFTTVDPQKSRKPSFGKISTRDKMETSLDDTKSKSFDTDELQAIFDGYLYRPKPLSARKEVHHFHFWFPLIALYTGMRINEIAGLSTRAVEQSKGGIWHFKIEADAEVGRRIKNIASKRRIPVHRHLIELGFIEYVVDRKKLKSVMLFDGQHYNDRNGWGNTATRFFTRVPSGGSPGVGYFWDIGIHRSAHDGRDFHAFRHTLIDRLRACGVNNDYDIEAITGHEKTNVSEADRYGDGPKLNQKAEKLNRVHYADLDLSHISYERFKTYYKSELLRSLRAFEKERKKQLE